MTHKEKLHRVCKTLEADSILVLFGAEKKVRNRDVLYEYRNSSDLLYLTGYNEPGMILCLTPDGKANFFLKFPDPKMERWSGKMLSPEKVQADFQLEKDDVRPEIAFWTDIPSLLKNKKILYLDLTGPAENISRMIRTANDLNKNTRDATFGPDKIFHVNKVLHESRVLKSADEIAKIQRAVDITAAGFIDIMKYSRQTLGQAENVPLFEYNIKARIESSFKNNGAMNLAYPTIVASGNNANYLHYEHSSRLIAPNDLVLVDAGCEWLGYAGDITRTFPAGGKFTPAQREIYDIVLGAQKVAIEHCRPGNSFESVHERAVNYIVTGLWDLGLFKEVPEVDEKRENAAVKMVKPGSISEIIEKKLYRTYYMHYTSHYLGLDVHDVGTYFNNEGTSRPLEPGMVFTVEPGIYISEDYEFVPHAYRGIGIRIEDDICITQNSARVLSENIPRTVDELESMG